jgi:hypothetical protein
MKKLILILTTVIVVSSCGESSSNYKYLIYDNRGQIFECNFYNENEDGCIMFNNQPGQDNTPGTPTILCGNYTIRKIK